jgi:tripartite-type tricarboxylate transporter receptor subunit TctC
MWCSPARQSLRSPPSPQAGRSARVIRQGGGGAASCLPSAACSGKGSYPGGPAAVPPSRSTGRWPDGTAWIAIAALTAILLLPPAEASAQNWPARLVRIIVPAAAGGSSDAAARLVANHFQAVFGRPFIIENKPGNGNALGAALVAQAEPDGHTLLLSNSASNLTVPLVAGNAGYDPVTDFSHVVMLTSSPYMLAVHPRLGVKSLAEFIALARAQKLAYTAANRGGLGNIGGEYFQRLAGISMQHVPYRGGAPAVADVIAGHLPAIFSPVTTLGEHVRSGALVALAITSTARVPVFPDVPTFAESGYPELVMASWFGLSGPKKLAPDIADRINREARAFLKEPQMRKLAENDASEPLDADAAGFTSYVAAEVARWGAVVKALDIKVEE